MGSPRKKTDIGVIDLSGFFHICFGGDLNYLIQMTISYINLQKRLVDLIGDTGIR